jgi:hypothetical protein
MEGVTGKKIPDELFYPWGHQKIAYFVATLI